MRLPEIIGGEYLEKFMEENCMDVEVEEYDKGIKDIVPEGAQMERIASGFGFTEGPLWCGDYLLFSDIPKNRIIRLDMYSYGPEVTTFRSPSGNSNGLTLDKSGRLVACESSARRMTRTELDGSVERSLGLGQFPQCQVNVSQVVVNLRSLGGK